MKLKNSFKFYYKHKWVLFNREGILINWNPVTNKPYQIVITKALKHMINSNYKDSLLTYQGAIDFGDDIRYKPR